MNQELIDKQYKEAREYFSQQHNEEETAEFLRKQAIEFNAAEANEQTWYNPINNALVKRVK